MSIKRDERFASLRAMTAFAIAAIAAAAILAAVVPQFYAMQWSSWVLYGILALSLVWVWGHGGIFSFGQGAFFGIGAYAYGIAAINLLPVTGETLTAVVTAAAIAAAAAALLGYFMFYGRIGDVYVAIITLATSLVLLTFMASTADRAYQIGAAPLGGYNGMVDIPPLSYGLPSQAGNPLSLSAFFIAVVVLAAALVVTLTALERSPYGRRVAAVRENELRSQLLGYDVRRSKLATFTLGGAIAGLAGALFASWALFINPEVFGLQQAALVVIWALVGGRASYVGAFVGAFLVQGLAASLGGVGGGLTPIVLGAVLIFMVLVLPRGLVPTTWSWLKRALPGMQAPGPALPQPRGNILDRLYPGDGGAELSVTGLGKSFGQVRAVDDLTLGFSPWGVHCLLGPNGAGKSTVFNLLVGRFWPSAGRITLGDRDITRVEMHVRVQSGLGIKLQVPCLFNGLSVFENLWLAAYPKAGGTREATQRAVDMADWLNLTLPIWEDAGVLAHGQQQWLEIGMVLLGAPDVILLDEPTAGMTREETVRTAELISRLGRSASVVVVEHDMEFVRLLDVPSVIFHQGRIFARGRLDELQRNEAVLDIYLGRGRRHADT